MSRTRLVKGWVAMLTLGCGCSLPWPNPECDPDVTPITYYLDRDRDGYGDPRQNQLSCPKDTSSDRGNEEEDEWVTNSEDCDDNNGAINPDGVEKCGNNRDDDCDNSVDEVVSGTALYYDNDHDGYPGTSASGCCPEGYDCGLNQDENDNNNCVPDCGNPGCKCEDTPTLATTPTPSIEPTPTPGPTLTPTPEPTLIPTPEENTATSEPTPTPTPVPTPKVTETATQKSEPTLTPTPEPTTTPTAEESSQSPTPTEGLPTPPPTPACDGQGYDQHYVYLDFDDDDFGSGAPIIVLSCEGKDLPNLADQNGDCDDLNPYEFPGNLEVCDGWDNDCSGAPAFDEVDEDNDEYLLCADFVNQGWENAEGETATEGDDCDDDAAQSYPGNQEIGDGWDNDCDGITDETP